MKQLLIVVSMLLPQGKIFIFLDILVVFAYIQVSIFNLVALILLLGFWLGRSHQWPHLVDHGGVIHKNS